MSKMKSLLFNEEFSVEELNGILKLLEEFNSLADINLELKELTGISSFFKNNKELEEIYTILKNGNTINILRNIKEWGDYQTPASLANKICRYLKETGCSPRIIIEPTYGKGIFITSSLDIFDGVRTVYGVEIEHKYELFFKISLLTRVLKGLKNMSEINIYLDDILFHTFPESIVNNEKNEILIIGNPPWVTNAELSLLNSQNIPEKNNFKNHKGLDAITGKSNFDIAEYIILRMLETFSDNTGTIAIICKNSVIKNILKDLPERQFKIDNIKSLKIDAKKEFNASCDASVFIAKMGVKSSNYTCEVSSLDSPELISHKFGWSHGNFVSNIDLYSSHKYLDGNSPLIWRQGVKHDASKVMQLDIRNNNLINGFNEIVNIENDLLYPLIKSSGIKKFQISNSDKMVIITQSKPGEDTSFIEDQLPKTWNYLIGKSEYLDKRKSSIYKNKPKFSIFGIGDYSYMPYKVAISGLYKDPIFSLILPINKKPVMFDDTCYILGFDSYNNALFTCSLLNSRMIKDFIKSIAFLDSKRVYTKELLMRIDFKEAIKRLAFKDIQNIWNNYGFKPNTDISDRNYDEYKDWLIRVESIKNVEDSVYQPTLSNY